MPPLNKQMFASTQSRLCSSQAPTNHALSPSPFAPPTFGSLSTSGQINFGTSEIGHAKSGCRRCCVALSHHPNQSNPGFHAKLPVNAAKRQGLNISTLEDTHCSRRIDRKVWPGWISVPAQVTILPTLQGWICNCQGFMDFGMGKAVLRHLSSCLTARTPTSSALSLSLFCISIKLA